VSLGIPYMGSKDRIIASLAMNFPKADHFYDLFGGGFSVTHYMLLRNRYKSYHYNEIKEGIVALVKDSISGKYNHNCFKPAWISREDFYRLKDTDPYVAVIWSFGNTMQYYMFSKQIEPYKKAMHMAVVFDEFDDLSSEVLGFAKWPSICKTVKQKRLYLRQKIEYYRVTKIPKVLHQFLNEKQLQQLQQVQQLQQLEQLQKLEGLNCNKLNFSSKDYREIDILPNSIVYCDIPYYGTDCMTRKKSYGDTFNHTDFFDWAASRKFPVFISEYNISDKRFKLVYEIQKYNNMADAQFLLNAYNQERLYWNGVT
jgi:hypothetical protein